MGNHVETQTEMSFEHVECQTDITIDDMYKTEQFIDNTIVEITDLKKNVLDTELSQKCFENDNEKTKFYTGLPTFSILMGVFALISGHITSGPRSKLPKFTELLMVLIRLRFNFALQDLAYRFNVSVSTASRVFYKWLDVMDVRLKFLIRWPEKCEIKETMPAIFKRNFGNKVAVIIDCFEVFIERPSSLIARAMTWSTYKHHNTIKFLIGITPQGVISFISSAWCGRVSDKYLTEHSNFLKHLLPGDLVLADRGFDISDSVAYCGATLKLPAFTRGKDQLSAVDIEDTRKIANVRIHVERVIGLVRRKYTILQSTLPIDLLMAKGGNSRAPVDKIARVCCALTNLSDSVIPFN